jgi:DNA ligase D-like protein (predicted 3'-phosphoesterase)
MLPVKTTKKFRRKVTAKSGLLRAYLHKRDFHRTAEPQGKGTNRRGSQNRFVVQKHDASRLHYDFRLELGGTLKSWAVPKGIPFVKGEKRLAVQVEDHPLDYAAFEGSIPKGQYGGGTVMVWDSGVYECLGGDPQKDLAAGKLHFALHGQKLDGEWTLVRIKRAGDNVEKEGRRVFAHRPQHGANRSRPERAVGFRSSSSHSEVGFHRANEGDVARRPAKGRRLAV